jgi:ribosomal protein L37AE/L43A
MPYRPAACDEWKGMKCPTCGLPDLQEDSPGLLQCHSCGHVEAGDSLPENELAGNLLTLG